MAALLLPPGGCALAQSPAPRPAPPPAADAGADRLNDLIFRLERDFLGRRPAAPQPGAANCPSSVAELSERFTRQRERAAREIAVVNQQAPLLHQTRAQMRERGDACSDEFRQRNTAALTALGGLSLERLRAEVVQTGICTTAAQQRLLRQAPPPPNLSTLVSSLGELERNVVEIDGQLAVAHDIALRRRTGFEENLRQCR